MNVKTLTITNVILVIAVIVLFFLQFSSKNEVAQPLETKTDKAIETPIVSKTITGEEPAFKVAYVNSDTVTTYYDFSKHMTSKLQASQSDAESKLKGLYGQYEKQRKDFEAQAPVMGQDEMQRKAQEIGRLEQSIMQKEQELSAALAQKEAQVMTDYVYETDKFMQVIGKQLGYDYVMSYRVGGPMLYANPELDITAEVVELLNLEYKKSKEPKQPSTEK